MSQKQKIYKKRLICVFYDKYSRASKGIFGQ